MPVLAVELKHFTTVQVQFLNWWWLVEFIFRHPAKFWVSLFVAPSHRAEIDANRTEVCVRGVSVRLDFSANGYQAQVWLEINLFADCEYLVPDVWVLNCWGECWLGCQRCFMVEPRALPAFRIVGNITPQRDVLREIIAKFCDFALI